MLDVRLGLHRDQDGLAVVAFELNDPAAASYGGFLDLDEIAAEYGASADDQERVQAALDERGIESTVDPTGGIVEASMSVADARDLFGVEFKQGTLDDGTTYARPRGTPRLPEDLDDLVDEVVGLTRTVPAGEPARDVTAAADDQACAESRATTQSIQARYGIAALAADGLTGDGVTVAVPATDAYEPAPLDVWADCIGATMPPVSVIGGDGRDAGRSTEIELDLATLVAAAPQLARIDVAEFDVVGWVGEPYLATLDQASGPVDVVSSSESYCETELPAGDVDLTEWVLAAMAAAGVTVVVASGDRGSSACAPKDPGLAVEYPASSPFVTAVGGTQFDRAPAGPPPDESVLLIPDKNLSGGGGDSTVLPSPPYQQPLGVEYRRLPDVAYIAAPSAWPQIPVCDADTGECRWARIGGTSAAAPLFVGGVALLKQSLAADGKVPPGLLNALLGVYVGRASADAPFDVTRGTNELFTDACCAAAPGFDAASGWGTVDLADLTAVASALAPTG